jgi:threonine aldolase
VGDDVYGDDPTVHMLEERIAERTGKAAAVFVPSGTMGNQIAIHVLTEPGNEVLLERHSHIFLYEQGGMAANSGCLAHIITGERGVMPVESIVEAFRGDDEHVARLRLICFENTHNRAGGVVVPLATLQTLAAAARERGARVHLDGARLWNAEVATGIPLREWATVADTVMMCFSKGLGAPIGSILAGSADVIHEARRVRKRWGGSMRQVGIIAAAALHALDHHVERLADDHRRARRLADRLRLDGVEVAEPQTNIVFAQLRNEEIDCRAIVQAMEAQGVLMSAYGPGLIRAITHLDVDDEGIESAGDAFREAVTGSRAGITG